MIDSHGHVKLIDFGFAKKLSKDKDGYKKTLTMCGTPAYLAPEILLKTGYGPEVDIWSIGVLLCEMIGGFTPFSDSNPNKIYERIL